jgi:preprotein translocase subunit YajC
MAPARWSRPATNETMSEPSAVLRASLAMGGSPGGEANPLASLILMGLIFGIFYFVLIMPMRSKQKKLEQMIAELKSGDRVIINPGIFGTIEGVEDNTFHVRIAEKTRIKVLKSAVTGLQEPPSETEKK